MNKEKELNRTAQIESTIKNKEIELNLDYSSINYDNINTKETDDYNKIDEYLYKKKFQRIKK